jgi:hypothetical protein
MIDMRGTYADWHGLEDLEKAKLEPLNLLPPLEESDVSHLPSDIEKQRKEPAPWYEFIV